MKSIEVDEEVWQELEKIAKPFSDEEFTPNDVLRRVLGLTKLKKSLPAKSKTKLEAINKLRQLTTYVKSAFLTFLIDKYFDAKGNFKSSSILNFMRKFSFITMDGLFINPWMEKPYKGKKDSIVSCKNNIEHFRQCRQFGCWYGNDTKLNCDNLSCKYHPNIGGNCNLTKGIIWKRQTPESRYEYGKDYLQIVMSEIINKRSIPLKPLLNVLYFDKVVYENLVEKFKT